ncbi:MAG: YdeI/OmpD-associated family protein [Actinomycetota bacterium]|nr:YdeI/OmpD-associated family protein [Actinomycetota bacterium]
MIKFKTVLVLGGKTATGFQVPPTVVKELGKGQRPPVVVTIGDYSYRSTVAAYTGEYFLPLAGVHRDQVSLTAGDEFEVGLELDTAPRVVDLADDLSQALSADPKLLAEFRAMSYSHQRQHAESVDDAKTDATRQRRIDRVVEAMRERLR